MPLARVLVVEDHILLREVYVELLGALPEVRDCTVTGSVAEALAAAEKESFDLVLLDWMLPDGRGFQVHEARRDHLPAARWALVTSDGSPQVVREAHVRGFRGCVQKQNARMELRAMVVAVLQGGRYFSARSSLLLQGNARPLTPLVAGGRLAPTIT